MLFPVILFHSSLLWKPRIRSPYKETEFLPPGHCEAMTEQEWRLRLLSDRTGSLSLTGIPSATGGNRLVQSVARYKVLHALDSHLIGFDTQQHSF